MYVFQWLVRALSCMRYSSLTASAQPHTYFHDRSALINNFCRIYINFILKSNFHSTTCFRHELGNVYYSRIWKLLWTTRGNTHKVLIDIYIYSSRRFLFWRFSVSTTDLHSFEINITCRWHFCKRLHAVFISANVCHFSRVLLHDRNQCFVFLGGESIFTVSKNVTRIAISISFRKLCIVQ